MAFLCKVLVKPPQTTLNISNSENKMTFSIYFFYFFILCMFSRRCVNTSSSQVTGQLQHIRLGSIYLYPPFHLTSPQIAYWFSVPMYSKHPHDICMTSHPSFLFPFPPLSLHSLPLSETIVLTC